MRLAITGSAGRIGRELVEELSDTHDLCLIDRARVPSRKSCVVDLARHRVRSYSRPWSKTSLPSWMSLFNGIDVVVHLAAHSQVEATWTSVNRNNIQATWNVIEAAARCGVPRVVFASSNWAVKSMELRLAPDCYLPQGPKIDSDVRPCPVTAYGLSKAMGELTGRMFVDEGRLNSFIAVRIGWYNAKPPKDQIGRTRWISPADMRSLFRRCVEVEVQGFHVVYGVSAQTTSPYDLSYTRQLLSWEPKQLPS